MRRSREAKGNEKQRESLNHVLRSTEAYSLDSDGKAWGPWLKLMRKRRASILLQLPV
jgi:hypothetical protein